MGSVPLNSCEPARPADTNAAPVVRLRAYLFATSSVEVPEYSLEKPVKVQWSETLRGGTEEAPHPPLFFYLTTLGLARFLKETVPQVEPPAEGQSSNAQAVQAVEAWKHSDFLCHNYVLNGLIDPLYNVYCKTTTAKELWESLEASTRQKMLVQDLQVLLHDIHAEGMTLSETFQVAAIIEKLPPSWVEFKNYLKHKRKEMSVEDLVVRLRIEEDNKLAQKDTYTPESAKANMVEHAGSSSRFNSKGNKAKTKGRMTRRANGSSEYLALSGDCESRSSRGLVQQCGTTWSPCVIARCRKRANPRQVLTTAVAMDKSCIMGTCKCDIKGEGDVILKMTSEKELKLTNVLYVLEIRKNLIKCLLVRVYAVDACKLNVIVVQTDINKMISSANLIESSNVCMVGLGHEVNSGPFARLCAQHGNRHEFTAPYSLSKTVLLRKEPYLKEMVTAMLLVRAWPGLWGGSHSDSSYLLISYLMTKFQDKRQRNENVSKMRDKIKPMEEEVNKKEAKRARNAKSCGTDFVSFMVENEPHLTEKRNQASAHDHIGHDYEDLTRSSSSGDEPGQPRMDQEETYANTNLENLKLIDAEAEVIRMILNGIGESINKQDVKTKLIWESGKFTSRDGESVESDYSRFYKMINEMVRNKLKVDNMQVNVQFLQQLQPEWSRFMTIVKQQKDLDTISYHTLFDILKEHKNEVNEIRAKRIARNSNLPVLVAVA
ncbi:hypothetical protein Tco_0018730 [Tanacetum coccineum]